MGQMDAPLYRFYATFSAPGFLEVEAVMATSFEDAVRQAENICAWPWKGWPSPKGLIEITVDPVWTAVKLPDGRLLWRHEYEEEIGHAIP